MSALSPTKQSCDAMLDGLARKSTAEQLSFLHNFGKDLRVLEMLRNSSHEGVGPISQPTFSRAEQGTSLASTPRPLDQNAFLVNAEGKQRSLSAAKLAKSRSVISISTVVEESGSVKQQRLALHGEPTLNLNTSHHLLDWMAMAMLNI